MPNAKKKLDPKNFTQEEFLKRHDGALASGEIQPGDYLPELRPGKDGKIPVAKVVAEAPKVETPKVEAPEED